MARNEVPEANAEQIAAAIAARPATADDAVERNVREYGLWVAVQPIYVGMARAYNPNDPVPIANVEAHGYADNGLVVKKGSKAHNDLRATLGLPPLES